MYFIYFKYYKSFAVKKFLSTNYFNSPSQIPHSRAMRYGNFNTQQAAGYLTLAAGLRSTPVGAKRVPPAHSTAKYPHKCGCLARCSQK